MHNKKIKGSIAGLALAAVLVGGTFAWLTATDDVTNKFTTEGNKAEVDIWEDFDTVNAGKVVPGVAVDKKVKVQNLSSVTSFIRAKFDVKVTGTGVDKQPLDSSDIELKYGKSVITKDEVSASTDFSKLGGYWVEGNDGWFYYIGKVDSKDYTTNNLLESVTLKGESVNLKEGELVTFDVDVTAENIQINPSDAVDTWKNTETETNNELIIGALKATAGVGTDSIETGYKATK